MVSNFRIFMHKLKRFPAFTNVLNSKKGFSSIIFFVIFSWLMSSVIMHEPLQTNVASLSTHESFSSEFKEIELSSNQVEQIGLDADGTSALTEEQCFKLASFLGMSEKGLKVIHCEGGGNNEGVFIVKNLRNGVSKGLAFKKLPQAKLLQCKERIKVVAGPHGLGQVRIKGRKSAPLARTLGIVSWGECGCIEVMEEAPGESLCKIYSDLPESLSDVELKKLCDAFYASGNLIGKVHQANMMNMDQSPEHWRTLVFGDCHMRNILFDYATGTATMIDGEKSIYSTYPNIFQTPFYDLVIFIFYPLFFCKPFVNVLLSQKSISCGNAFLRGYVSSFPRDKRAELGNYVKEVIGLLMVAAQAKCDCQDNDYLKVKIMSLVQNLELTDRYADKVNRLWNGFVEKIYKKYDTSNTRLTCLRKTIAIVSNVVFDGI